MQRSILGLFVLVAGLALSASMAAQLLAGNGCCDHCGCATSCTKTCRLVTEEKKVEVVCWGCKCEDFCVGCHSTPGCTHCDEVCCEQQPGAEGICTGPRPFVWKEWMPGGARVYTRKKLMKKVVTKKVPSHKWVVEDLCPNCRAACQQ